MFESQTALESTLSLEECNNRACCLRLRVHNNYNKFGRHINKLDNNNVI